MKKKHTILLKSVTSAIVLLLFSYVVTNVGFELSGESDLIKKTNSVKSLIMSDDGPVPDSILFVNICYDKELVDVNDEDGFLKGQIDITNRQALYDFLELLSVKSDYKYVLMDIFFEDGISSNADSALFAKISAMDRIVIPKHRDATLAGDSKLEEKSSFSDYTTTLLGNDFNKYELLDGEEKSMALTMYEDITGNTIDKYGPFYFDSYSICNRTLFSKQMILFNTPYDKNGEKNYYHLTTDLLQDPEGTQALIKGKYIFVGDMELDDIHDTVQGELPGSVITANTFIALMNGKHKIPLYVIIILFTIYFIFSYSIFSHHSMSEILVNKIEKKYPKLLSPFSVNLLSWISYSLILSGICLFFYYTLYISYDIFLTATFLQGIDYIESKLNSDKV